jgi:hypothetical protein
MYYEADKDPMSRRNEAIGRLEEETREAVEEAGQALLDMLPSSLEAELLAFLEKVIQYRVDAVIDAACRDACRGGGDGPED